MTKPKQTGRRAKTMWALFSLDGYVQCHALGHTQSCVLDQVRPINPLWKVKGYTARRVTVQEVRRARKEVSRAEERMRAAQERLRIETMKAQP